MKHSKNNQYFLALGLICSIALFSCRKKDNRYEGNYIGTERHTYLDSGATSNTIDTTYYQEYVVTYSKGIYTFEKILDGPNNQVSTLLKKSIVDHEYQSPEGDYLKFSGDSMYFYDSNFSDYVENWDTEVWEFKAKRN